MKRADNWLARGGAAMVVLGTAACVCSGAAIPVAATVEPLEPTLDAGIQEELGFAPGATEPAADTLPAAEPNVPSDADVLEELFFAPLGGGDDGLCDVETGGAIFATGYSFDGAVYHNGDTITLPTYSTDRRLDFWEGEPHVCAADAAYLETVSVLAPWGERFEPRRPNTPDLAAAYLPIEAFPYGGAWTMRVENLGQFPEPGMETFEVTYLIPPPAEGVVYGIADDGRGLAGGFLPGEQVMVVIVGEDRIEQVSQVEADADGLVQFDATMGGGEFVLVGDVGPEHVIAGQRLDFASDTGREALYQMFWGG